MIITVADGLGSAPFSKEGSSKIVKLLIEIIKEEISYDNISLELLKRWKKSVTENLILYDTTIKFIHIKNGSVRYGGVGDGWIAFNTVNELISLTTTNNFSNQTDTILSFDLKNKFTINQIEENDVLNMLISTDGFSEDIDKDKGKALMDDVYNQVSTNSNAFEEDIINTLNNWPIESNKDDKTVIFVQRKGVGL